MSNLEKYRSLKQDNWKRTEVRMPQDLYSALQQYAKDNDLSLNSSMIALCEKGLEQSQNETPSIKDELIQMHKDAKEILESLKQLKEKPTA